LPFLPNYGTWQSCLCLLLVRSSYQLTFSLIFGLVLHLLNPTFFVIEQIVLIFVPYDVVLVNLENQTGFISTESVDIRKRWQIHLVALMFSEFSMM
jgi:hypothetical protein